MTSSTPPPAGFPPYRAKIEPGYIDYNGHLRDACYGVILSLAIDDVMDHLGLDAAYRQRTHNTLYTLETHLHYLHEVKVDDELEVDTWVLDADSKRLHVGCLFRCPRVSGAVAAGEAMLLHVHQGEKPTSAPFPPEVAARLTALVLTPEARAAWGPVSRKIEIKRRPAS